MPLTTIQAGILGPGPFPNPTNSSINFGVAVYEQNATLSTSIALTTGSNSYSFGPITVADGVTIIVPDGTTWSVY